MLEISNQKKIALIQVWLGPIPEYFKFHFETIKNLDYIDFLFFTDQEIEQESDNFKKIKLSVDDLQNLINSKLNLNLKFDDQYLYKVNDLKASYFFLFEDYTKEYSHVGFYDIDTLFGNIYKFIEPFLDEFDVISHGGSHLFRRTAGPLSIFKNKPDLIKAFDCDLFYDCLNQKGVCAFEEDTFYENVLKNNFRCKIIENVCSFVEKDGFFINYNTTWKDGTLKMDGKELLIFHFYHKNHVRLFKKDNTIKSFLKKTYLDDFYWVTYFSKNYESLAENLLDSLRKYSNRKLIAYTINYNVTDEFLEKWGDDQFIFERFDIEEGVKVDRGRDFNIISLKPKICMESLKYSKSSNFIFLDTDVYVTVNVDEITKLYDVIPPYPLFNSHIHDTILVSNEKTNWEWKVSTDLLFEYYGLKNERVYPRRKSNFFVYDKKSKWFFEEQIEVFYELKKQNKLDILFIFDEDTVNFLISKYQFNKLLPLIDMEENYDLNLDNFKKYSYNMTNISEYVQLPKNINDILIFHGFKNKEDYHQIAFNYNKSKLNHQNLLIEYKNNTLWFTKNNFLNDKSISQYIDFVITKNENEEIFRLYSQDFFNNNFFYISDIFLESDRYNLKLIETQTEQIIYNQSFLI